ncbi:hypothetical protein D3C81_2135670 [compost metagenome]
MASTKMYSAPVGWMTVCTRALSAASPMYTTRTPFIELACTSLNTTLIMSAILAEADEPKAIMLPGLTPQLIVVVALSTWRSYLAWNSGSDSGGR